MPSTLAASFVSHPDSKARSRGVRRLVSCAAFAFLAACGPPPAAAAGEVDRLADLLCLGPGAMVADLGAGDGEYSEDLARLVGETGHVFATEVKKRNVEKIRERMEEAGLGNVTAVLGDQERTGLPTGCCDAVLVRKVYHHFQDPPMMRADLKKALRPGGLLAIVDLSPQKGWHELPGVPDRGGHGIAMEDLIDEMTGDGFEVVSRIEDWESDDEDELYCVVFKISRGGTLTPNPSPRGRGE